MKKIAVTGTKGKTSVVLLLSHVLKELGKDPILTVTTLGHALNGVQRSTGEDSLRVWGLSPTVAPGRYLYEFLSLTKETHSSAVAVLETSLGCSSIRGLGYKVHDVGMFLNVYKDHIGSSPRLRTQDDIYEAKKFVAQQIGRGGWFVGNLDDERVSRAFHQIPKRYPVSTLPFGLHLDAATVSASCMGDRFVTIKDQQVVYVCEGREESIVSVADVSWTFGGSYQPSVYNLLAVTAGVIAVHEGRVPSELGSLLRATMLDEDTGRLTLLRSTTGVTILLDYAHDAQSLSSVAGLARRVADTGARTVAVVRLPYDRTPEAITEVATHIASLFDEFVVYDKIDGVFRKPKEDMLSTLFTQEVGKISRLFYDGLVKAGARAVRIIREDEAIAHAAQQAKPGDTVVVIVNDNIHRSIQFVKDHFGDLHRIS